MKHNPIILMTLLLCLTLFSCKKQEQETLTPKIKNDKVETTTTTAIFTWTVDWLGKLISVVEVSENEDMSHSQFYGSETETDNHSFSVTASDLKVSTKYYYRHVVWNHYYADNKFVMEVMSFTTKTDVPKIKTVEVIDVTRTTATVIGEVIDECGAEVTERGVCWNTSHNPTVSDDHLSSGNGIGSFTTEISNLRASQTYYVRAYAKNNNGTEYGEELDFVTGEAGLPEVIIQSITVNQASVTMIYKVISDGGTSVTKHGVCWSSEPNPEYNGHHQSEGGGTGEFSVNLMGLDSQTQYHVRAYAINSVGTAYSNDQSFITSATPQAPTGAICGLFSVSETKKVWFSQGNLQYIGSASTPYWKFADKQWTVLGDGSQASAVPNVDRDLFGWGTSGYHDGNDPYNINYQPYSTNEFTVNETYNYYGYGPSTNQSNPNIAGSHYDWGVHNKISNGGNWAGLWRTLTKDEWVYLFNTRQASMVNGTPNARYAKGKVNDVYGVILFPDSYEHPSGLAAPFGINDSGTTGWNYNSYNTSEWAKMEEKGCVFLPAAGYRWYYNEIEVDNVNRIGKYYSSTYSDKVVAYHVTFRDSELKPQEGYFDGRSDGLSVRLVRDAQ